jgi:predicted RNase H-like HicB family nuclease/DNA-binding XRE family transcriptional regulator
MSMLIEGRIWKDGTMWLAESEIADVVTQGKTRTEAATMLADAIESLVNREGFKVTVRDESREMGTVTIAANEPAALVALVLRRQRIASGLSLSQVAERLGQSSKTAYARYEQGNVMPSLEKVDELLRAVAPDAAIVLGKRMPAKSAPHRRGEAKGRARA